MVSFSVVSLMAIVPESECRIPTLTVSCALAAMAMGNDAMAVLDHVCTRDLSKIYPGKSAYAAILNDAGLMTDDCIFESTSPPDGGRFEGQDAVRAV